MPATDTTDAEPVDVQSQAPAPLEGEVLQASNNESQAPVDLPPKVLKKTQAVVNRARESQGWKAARDYVSAWPAEARDYALRLLSAAEYQAAQGE